MKKKKIVPLRADGTLGVHVVLLWNGQTEHAQTLHSLFFITLHLHHFSPEGVPGNLLALQTEALGLDQVVQGPCSVQIFHAHFCRTLHCWPKDAFLQEHNVSTKYTEFYKYWRKKTNILDNVQCILICTAVLKILTKLRYSAICKLFTS